MWKRLYGPNLITKVDRLGTYSAALAYYFVLSLVPFLAVTFFVGMEIASRLDLDKSYAETYTKRYAEVVGDIIPTESANDIKRIFDSVQTSANGGLLTIGFLVALYTSFNLMEQIIRTLLFIFDDPRRQYEWSWVVVIKTVALLFLWMCLLLLISVSAVESSVLRHLLNYFVQSSTSRAIATASQVLIVIGAIFGTFFLTYYFVPAKRYKRGMVVEGALLASCGWIVCSMLFAYLLPRLMTTSVTYIALGSIVGVLLWAQACAWSIILGACWIVRFSGSKR